MVRRAAVAGYFYPGSERELRLMIKELFYSESGPRGREEELAKGKEVSGVVSPHAGYLYSGAVACWSFYSLSLASPVDTIVIIGPNHRGMGKRVALSDADFWETPLGEVAVDQEAVEFLASHYSLFSSDSRAHQLEHSIEVQIPFLQYFLPYPFQILPITVWDQALEVALEMGQALQELSRKRKIAIVASSDFSHYEPAQIAETKDRHAISCITSLQTEEFYKVIRRENISICGPAGIAALMEYHKSRSPEQGKLLFYSHSGRVTGDYQEVVGYASLLFPIIAD
ncbi:MAG: AmmeMemoRadiSam system protein B [Candidatus Atribacteria bacterium]|nr:AmmeMemoRadiSam system protein B [Candidatus Atribacteria bacterium]